MRPLCIDLFCGLGGWTEGFLAEGFDVIGFDVEQHVYGAHRYPAQLVLQDVRTVTGSQFKDAAIIVASPPCQEFSYRAMPWKRARALGPPVLGMELFAQAFRIQREASVAADRRIPLVVENVKGAQKYVGRAAWRYGSFYLWGDVPALMPVAAGRAVKVEMQSWSNFARSGAKVGGRSTIRQFARRKTRAARGSTSHTTQLAVTVRTRLMALSNGAQAPAWFDNGICKTASRSSARKAASARIAKIPLPLAQWIAHVSRPHE